MCKWVGILILRLIFNKEQSGATDFKRFVKYGLKNLYCYVCYSFDWIKKMLEKSLC